MRDIKSCTAQHDIFSQGHKTSRFITVKMKYCIFLPLIILIVSAIFIESVSADTEFKDLSDVFDKASLGFDLHMVYRADKNPYFGANISGTDSRNSNFGEIFCKLRITVQKDVGWTTMGAQIAPVFMSTIDQDVYGLDKDTSDLDFDQAWLKFDRLFGNPVSFKVGMQDIQIEKHFLMGIGRQQKSANWLLFNQSFPFGIRLDGDFGAFGTSAFWARSDNYWQKWDEGIKDDIEVAGLNTHYDVAENTYIYGGFYRKFDYSGLQVYSPEGQDVLAENNTENWDVGFNAVLTGFMLEGEFVYQTGDAGRIGSIERDRDAFGGFASATYTFPADLSPFIRGTYMHYSGDSNLEDDVAEDFDPMFYGFIGWNRWIIGELTGEVHQTNSNKRVMIAEAGFSPVPTMIVTLMYLNHRLDEKNYMNYPTGSDKWADEVNLMLDFQANEHLFTHLGLGYVTPNDAAEEVFGNDENAFFAQLWLTFSF